MSNQNHEPQTRDEFIVTFANSYRTLQSKLGNPIPPQSEAEAEAERRWDNCEEAKRRKARNFRRRYGEPRAFRR